MLHSTYSIHVNVDGLDRDVAIDLEGRSVYLPDGSMPTAHELASVLLRVAKFHDALRAQLQKDAGAWQKQANKATAEVDYERRRLGQAHQDLVAGEAGDVALAASAMREASKNLDAASKRLDKASAKREEASNRLVVLDGALTPVGGK